MKLLSGKHHSSSHFIGLLLILVTFTSLVDAKAPKKPIPSKKNSHHRVKGPAPTNGIHELHQEIATVGQLVKCSLSTYFGMHASSGVTATNFGSERYCITTSKEVITLHGDIQAVLGRFNYSFQDHHTELHFPQNAIGANSVVSVNELYTQGQITAEFSSPIIPPRTIATKGTSKVLVVLVTDEYGNKPYQTEDQIYHDVFGEKKNNLVSLFSLSFMCPTSDFGTKFIIFKSISFPTESYVPGML